MAALPVSRLLPTPRPLSFEKRSSRFATLPAYALLGVLGLPGVLGVTAALPVASGPPQELDSHQRMVAALTRIAENSDRDHSYLETDRLKEYRVRLDGAQDLPPVEHARLLLTLGLLELRSGDLERAVEALRRGYGHLAPLGDGAFPRLRSRMCFQLALANLRLGETQNCVAHHNEQSCILPIGPKGRYREKASTREALRLFLEFADMENSGSPRVSSARWLANIAAMALGEFPEGLPEKHRLPASLFTSDVPFPRFTNVAPRVGLDALDMAGGAVVEDFDGDGRLDVLSSSWDPGVSLQLFVRGADGSFVDREGDSGLDGITGGLNINHADYDNDGDADVLVLRGAWLRGDQGRQPNSLLRNDGHARFRDVTFDAGLGDEHYPTQTAGWADYDNDGDLDLYIGNEASRIFRFRSQLFENDGQGSFRDIGREAGVMNMRYAKGVAWGDIDRDGWSDLYVSNLGGGNRLYRNENGKHFQDVAALIGVAEPRDSFACWFWDYDNDGALDLYVSSYYQGGAIDNQGSAEGLRLYPVVADYLGLEHDAESARLYRGDGAGRFVDVAAQVGLDRVSMPMGANFGDLDNDGWLDFYLGTGYPYYDGLMPNVMYKSLDGERFADVTFAGGFGHVQKGHGIAFADLDDDGDQDVFEQMGGAFRADAFGNVLFENPGFGNHWLKLELQGRGSNRLGVGARVHVLIREGNRTRSIHRQVGTGGSFGAHPHVQHIGLGAASKIEVLEITWPATGQKQRFHDLPLDRKLTVEEGASAPRVEALKALPFER